MTDIQIIIRLCIFFGVGFTCVLIAIAFISLFFWIIKGTIQWDRAVNAGERENREKE